MKKHYQAMLLGMVLLVATGAMLVAQIAAASDSPFDSDPLSRIQSMAEVHGTLVLTPPTLIRIPADVPAAARKNAQFGAVRALVPLGPGDVTWIEAYERPCGTGEGTRNQDFLFLSTVLNGFRTDGANFHVGPTFSSASGWTYCPKTDTVKVSTVADTGQPTTSTQASAVIGEFTPDTGNTLWSIRGNYCGGVPDDPNNPPDELPVICQSGGSTATGTVVTSTLYIYYLEICTPAGVHCHNYGVGYPGGAIPLMTRANLTPSSGPSGEIGGQVVTEGLLVKEFLYTGYSQYGPFNNRHI